MILLNNKQGPNPQLLTRGSSCLFSFTDLQVSYNLADFSWAQLDLRPDYKLDPCLILRQMAIQGKVSHGNGWNVRG